MNATLPCAAAHSVRGAPVTTIAELDALDNNEMREGYRDGRAGELEPGGNRSRSYGHGWRNRTVDGGHRLKNDAQVALATVVDRNFSNKGNSE
ncbi:hypothetical protein [Sphingomonas faeni]|uniref:hypothetical protein n=1 Tax=Sphingomonas faeni TaxID=185950 RepID=UPI0020C81E0E|nr:hypothetical protein [Sphingomonas faeni]MCP8893218.1 hypothetical protein [Sphingomonas faeni]